ncbi:hypothetical protein Tco_0020795 [Tanacetum coccineum]
MFNNISPLPPATSIVIPDYDKNDSLFVMWLYARISLKLVDMVLNPDASAATIWEHLKTIFHDNKDNRIIQLDNEIHVSVHGFVGRGQETILNNEEEQEKSSMSNTTSSPTVLVASSTPQHHSKPWLPRVLTNAGISLVEHALMETHANLCIGTMTLDLDVLI